MEQDTTTTKVCTCCKQLKLKYVDFAMVNKKNRPNPQVRPQCRACRSKNEMERRNKNRDKWLAKQAEWRMNNRDKIKQYHIAKREENLRRFKEYREQNVDKIKENKHLYYSKIENKIKRNKKQKDRKKVDEAFRIMCNIRTRIHNVLKQNKSNKTDELLGCSKTQLKEWLSFQLTDELSWDNYGTLWHIDHVIPLAFFDLVDINEQWLAFHWSNLRPLYACDNLEKKDKIIQNDTLNHIATYNSFILENNGYLANISNCWCERITLVEGYNPQDDGDFDSFLKWIISSDDIFKDVAFND